jgi:ABC-type xylose transport system permease subunit
MPDIYSTMNHPMNCVERTRIWWSKYLDVRAFLVFQRVLRFYNTFVVLSALVSGLALATLTFEEFHPTTSGLAQVGEGFLCSSAITALLAAVLATMLMFVFQGVEQATRMDLAVAWSPLVLLDLSIIEFLIGIICWYCAKNNTWRGVVMLAQLCSLLGLTIVFSIWIWLHLVQKGNLGREEREATGAHTRAADE